jgi:hypothetical protein
VTQATTEQNPSRAQTAAVAACRQRRTSPHLDADQDGAFRLYFHGPDDSFAGTVGITV